MQYTNRYQYRKASPVVTSLKATVWQGIKLVALIAVIWFTLVLYTA